MSLSKRPLLALAAAALLCPVGAAQANEFSISSQSFRLIWNPLTIAGQEGSGLRIQCNVTLEGTFLGRTYIKEVGLPLGDITGATLGSPCTSGEATVLAGGLPWGVVYDAFTGTLPSMTTVSGRFLDVSIGFTFGGLNCLISAGSAGVTATALLGARGTVTGVRLDETDVISPTTGIFLCRALRVSLSGTGSANDHMGNPYAIILI
jgi:hypothetical protein